jgi:hypothetical protein
MNLHRLQEAAVIPNGSVSIVSLAGMFERAAIRKTGP